MAKKTTETTPQTPDAGNVTDLGNGQVDTTATDSTKADYKALQATLKAAGLDYKGLYTEYSNDPDDVKDTLTFLVGKHAKNAKNGISQETMDSAIAMFAAMAAANAPKVKVVKEIPAELSEAWKTACAARRQFYVERKQAQNAFDALWNVKQGESKDALVAARAAVESAGFYVKGDAVVSTKSGSTTSTGEHGNAGAVKLSIGWIDIKIGGVEYDSWKSAVQALEPSMIVATSTNYLANTHFANKCAEKGLPIAVTIKLALKGHTAEEALQAWNAVDSATGKFASGARRKLAEVGASITIA